MSQNKFKLIERITDLSESGDWDQVKLEWYLYEIYQEDHPLTCICGHTPIKEICVIRNKINGQEAIVGNVCVKKFLGLPSGLIFDALKRIQEDEEKALNSEAIGYAYFKKWMNDWEAKFYQDTFRKRKLSPKQRSKRIQINRRVILRTVNAFEKARMRHHDSAEADGI